MEQDLKTTALTDSLDALKSIHAWLGAGDWRHLRAGLPRAADAIELYARHIVDTARSYVATDRLRDIWRQAARDSWLFKALDICQPDVSCYGARHGHWATCCCTSAPAWVLYLHRNRRHGAFRCDDSNLQHLPTIVSWLTALTQEVSGKRLELELKRQGQAEVWREIMAHQEFAASLRAAMDVLDPLGPSSAICPTCGRDLTDNVTMPWGSSRHYCRGCLAGIFQCGECRTIHDARQPLSRPAADPPGLCVGCALRRLFQAADAS